MDSFDPFELYHENGLFSMVVSGLVICIAGFSFLSLVAWSKQDIEIADVAAQIASSLATIALVGITGWYTLETRRLAAGNEETRQREIARQKEEKKRKKGSVRRMLKEEVSTIMFESLNHSDKESIYEAPHVIPTRVYRENTTLVGTLSEEEIETISSYYTLVYIMKNRKGLDYQEDKKETSSSIFSEPSNLFCELADAQKQAIKAIENEL